MAYKCLFMDNSIYTAQDVNDAISSIVSGGVSGYPFGSGALSDLNAAVAELTNGGTNYKGTSCLVVNDNGTYKISEGGCIMNDGSQIIFDSYGYEITPTLGVKQYVYLERDVLHNTINVVVAGQSGGQDTIPLAEIAANGTITDRRCFAKAKISLAAEAENIGVNKRLQFTIPASNTYSYDLGFNGWKYIIIHYGTNLGYIAVLELNDNESTRVFPQNNSNNSSGYIYEYRCIVTRRGSVLEFQNDRTSSTGYNVDIELR